ncbi:MAG: NAD-dependent isocitrate dehydrogenase [Chryseobacterium sp.]|nr:MAG: NAD-dependent isocitrate dehydrogenase [Chryseobacterium sp.]
MKKVTLIIGDGIGPEIVESVREIFSAAKVQIEWEMMNAGISVMKDGNQNPLPEYVLESIKRNKVALKAPLTTPVGEGFRSVNVALRKELDLYANVRPIISLEGVKSRYENIDLCIVRENTEDLYSGVEHMVGEDAAESIKIITRKGSERIMYFALRVAEERKRAKSRLTVVHKANIMKCTDGLFLSVAQKIAKDYLDIDKTMTIDDRIIDNMCMQLVQRPETFDVIVTQNLYGDILSDLCAGLVGGLGVAPGANIGDNYAVYEAIHGTAPDIAGKGIANPTSLLLSATMMLRDKNIQDFDNADRIEAAIKKVLKEGVHVTGDLGGKATTAEFTQAIIDKLV